MLGFGPIHLIRGEQSWILKKPWKSGIQFAPYGNSSPISWSSRKQNLVATSTCNAEYVALSEAGCESIWLQKVCEFIDLHQLNYYPAQLYCDNTGAIALCYNPCHHKRSKHIEIKYHHVREHVLQGTFTLDHVASKENFADGFTKPLAFPLFKKFKGYCSKTNDLDWAFLDFGTLMAFLTV